jgi:ferredoxin/flavodoxin---NADP+ reductase
MAELNQPEWVAVVGAGPAGLFAARELCAGGASVVLFNRDFKPGGLAEYGIYAGKHKMKEGLRKQFRNILATACIHYFGNVIVGQAGDLTLDDLRALGFRAVLVTTGAQGTKRLGIPGENLRGVYNAKDLVYHYNRLPPYSQRPLAVGQRVAVIGAGNVMLDIVRWLARRVKVDEITAVVRRGPAEVKFDRAEMETVAANLDVAALDTELERVRPRMEALGQDVAAARAFILAGLPSALPAKSATRFRFLFLASPASIEARPDGGVDSLEYEENTLVRSGDDTKAKDAGTRGRLNVDTVVYAIGDTVDSGFGLPVQGTGYVKAPQPRFPVGGISYEAFDPSAGKSVDDVFLAGWAREASEGMVGAARKDGANGAQAVLEYLKTLPPAGVPVSLEAIQARLARTGKAPIGIPEWLKLCEIEQEEARRHGVEEYRFGTNEMMLEALAKAGGSPSAR